MICSWIPLITYFVLLLLLVVLLAYLLRRHVIGHVLHTAWAYALYGMLVLSALLAIAEYVFCMKVLYEAVFSIAGVIIVFIFDILLTLIAKSRAPAKKHSAVIAEIRHAVKPKKKK